MNASEGSPQCISASAHMSGGRVARFGHEDIGLLDQVAIPDVAHPAKTEDKRLAMGLLER